MLTPPFIYEPSFWLFYLNLPFPVVDSFERNAESILTDPTLGAARASAAMHRICSSPAEASLALQALPLLHLAGFAAPRHSLVGLRSGMGSGIRAAAGDGFEEGAFSRGGSDMLGHSGVALPVLLSEIYRHICPPALPVPSLQHAPTLLSAVASAGSRKGAAVSPSIAAVSALAAEHWRVSHAKFNGESKVTGRGSSSGGGGSGGAEAHVDDGDEDGGYEAIPGAVDAGWTAGRKRRQQQATRDLASASIGRRLLRVGIVAGSLDNFPGKIVIGLLETVPAAQRSRVEFIAMCYPTPRDVNTDRLNSLFDRHINLSPSNQTSVVRRVLEARPDFLLFADASLDSRVFALAHERLALWQGALWGWGSTLGIPTIDFYFAPEVFWKHSQCPAAAAAAIVAAAGADDAAVESSGAGWGGSGIGRGVRSRKAAYATRLQHPGLTGPQELFREQVVLLQGLPYIQPPAMVTVEEGRALLQTRYLLPANNQTHLYLFPGSVKHVHPEFDRAIDVILKTDPVAVVVFAVARSGRDSVPPTHMSVRHDLLHPPMPAAAVAKCLR